MRLRCDGETWTVVLGESCEIGGFSCEGAAGRWLIEFIMARAASGRDVAMKREILMAALLEPRRVQ